MEFICDYGSVALEIIFDREDIARAGPTQAVGSE
jgi:hypothetical protein